MDRRAFLGLAAAAPLAWRASLAAAAAPPRALVTCDTQARLALVDLAGLRVVGHVASLPDPRSIERVGAFAVVCHTAVGAVSVVDARTFAVRQVVHGFGEPRYVAAHPDGRHAFVTDSAPTGVATVDCLTGRVVGRLRLSDWARHVSLAPSGDVLWVGLGSASPRFAVVDVREPSRPRLARMVTPPFPMHDVVFAPGGDEVWVTSGASHDLALYRASGGLRLRLSAGAPPQHVAFAAGHALVTSGDDGTCELRRVADGHVLRTVAVPRGSYNVQGGPGGASITPSLEEGTLTVVRAAVASRVQVADSCHDACFV